MKFDATRVLYEIAVIFSVVVIVITTSYGIVMSIFNGVEVVGQTFVDAEFPPIDVFPIFYMKPVTWLSFAILLLTYSGIELFRDRVIKAPKVQRNFAKLLAFIAAALAAYEVLFNFTLWSGLIAADSIRGILNPDVIINQFPNTKIPWNINFASKMYFTLTVVATYFFIAVGRIEREENLG